MQLGFVGLGIMGRPMALNLLAAGHRLVVYARRAESLAPLVEAGATPCGSPREVASQAEVTFTMVGDTADVEQVLSGPDGIIAGARPGAVVVDMSTIAPGVTRRLAVTLAEHGLEMLDAPVSGGEQGALQGTLSIMVGGRRAVFERVLPLFQALGRNIVHCGEHGAGQVTKLCNQVLVGQTLAGVGEAFVLARAWGVDPARVREALLGGFAYSRILEVHGQRVLDRDFRPGFKARLHHKDMRLVLDAARQAGVALPGAALVSQYLNALLGSGRGEEDSAALVRMLERLNGLDVDEPRAAPAHRRAPMDS